MPLFRRRSVPTPTTPPAAPLSGGDTQAAATPNAVSSKGTQYWSDVVNIRAEWPESELNPEVDLAKWHEAMALFENDDYTSMMRCASLFSRALAHSLYGEGILHGDDFVNTVYKTLYCSLRPPPDGRTFADGAQRATRLVLTLIRENGWQPSSMGGQGLFDQLMTDRGNSMLLTTAIASSDKPWEGDLSAFFSVPAQRAVAPLPNPEKDNATQVVDSMSEILQTANAGDAASDQYLNGMALWANGRTEEGSRL